MQGKRTNGIEPLFRPLVYHNQQVETKKEELVSRKPLKLFLKQQNRFNKNVKLLLKS